MFNFALAREIYGGQPWLIDHVSFSTLFNILNDFRNGKTLSYDKENPLNGFALYDVQGAQIITNANQAARNDKQDTQFIAVSYINGPIVKNSGMSTLGMREVANNMLQMNKDRRVIGHILHTDSGGGSTSAVRFMSDAIKAVQETGKPVVQFVEKGGLNASAAYYIGSYSDYIISESKDNLVGSIGTMIQFAGYPKQADLNDGAKVVRAYATASVNKNRAFEQALEGNLEPIVKELLDPTNERFMASVRENRANIEDVQLTGEIFEASQVVGTLIDGIGNFQSAVKKVQELASSGQIKNFQGAQGPIINSSLINNSKPMTIEELKQQHPSLYSSIFATGENAGVKKERDRVGSWLAHSATDMDAVKSGISSGEEISATQREEFLVKANALARVEAVKSDSAAPVKTEEAKTEAKKEDDAASAEVDAFYGPIDAKLNLKK